VSGGAVAGGVVVGHGGGGNVVVVVVVVPGSVVVVVVVVVAPGSVVVVVVVVTGTHGRWSMGGEVGAGVVEGAVVVSGSVVVASGTVDVVVVVGSDVTGSGAVASATPPNRPLGAAMRMVSTTALAVDERGKRIDIRTVAAGSRITDRPAAPQVIGHAVTRVDEDSRHTVDRSTR
jgi:hypothetical protein